MQEWQLHNTLTQKCKRDYSTVLTKAVISGVLSMTIGQQNYSKMFTGNGSISFAFKEKTDWKTGGHC